MPKPYLKPSAKRVEQLTKTFALLRERVKRSEAEEEVVKMASVWFEPGEERRKTCQRGPFLMTWMVLTMRVDVVDGLIDARDHLDCEVQVKELGVIVLLLDVKDARRQLAVQPCRLKCRLALMIAMQRHFLPQQRLGQFWPKLSILALSLNQLLVEQERLHCIACGRIVDFGVDDASHGCGSVCVFVHIDETQPIGVAHYGHPGFALDASHQLVAASWDHEVDVAER